MDSGAGLLTDKKQQLGYQRSSLDNFYWLENHPTSGTILRGIIKISRLIVEGSEVQVNKTDMNLFTLGDAICKSIVVETRFVGANQIDYITILD